MPNLHIVIGDANTKKSSLLRCLTGLAKSPIFRDVKLVNGAIIHVYCVSSALQENFRPMTPTDFVQHVNSLNPSPTDIAITLRTNGRGNYPSAQAYLTAFANANYTIANVAILGQSTAGLLQFANSVNVVVVQNSQIIPANEVAAPVRSVWGWI